MFLEREPYRRRRLTDGARVLPVLGFVLILLPALWSISGTSGTAGEAVYLFVLWILLIGVAALISRPLRSIQDREANANRPKPPEGNLAEQNPKPTPKGRLPL